MKRRASGAICFALALSLGWTHPARAETPLPDFTQASAQLEAAAESLKAAQGGRERLAALGKAVTAHEVALRTFRTALRDLSAREAAAEQLLQADKAKLGELLGALQSLSRAPNSALMLYPGGPVTAIRSAGMMAEITPTLSAQADELKMALQELREVRALQEGARVEIKGALASLQDLRAQTAEALKTRRGAGLPSRDLLRQQAETAASSAKNLGDLATRLPPDTESPEQAIVTFSEARGLIPLPIAGKVTAAFGDTDPWGREGFGITVEAASFAQISAPWDGTIRYAGPLIDYGQVVILEPEPDTLIVLAGLERTTRSPGETVLQGERLGDLGGPIPTSDEFLLEETIDRDEIMTRKLYIELRRGGEAIDPSAWFDLGREETGG